MSLKRNVVANYAGQIYTGLVGIAVVPLYLRLMETEAYGLVGFFALLQAWSQLLDLGMSATMARETSRYAGGGLDARALRELLRTLEYIFWFFGALLAISLALAAPLLATNWLKVQALNRSDVEIALALMAAAVALRWVSGLYRGVITGLERQVWLNAFNAVVATARFPGAIPILLLTSASPIAFFAFQTIVSIIELWVVIGATYRLVPLPVGTRLRASFAGLGRFFAFSATIAFATVVWVVVTQVDKLVLSAVLSLADYGFYTAAVMAASAVTMLSAAISQAMLPRLTRLSQDRDETALVTLYRTATQWTVALTGPVAVALAALAHPVLWAWTGNRELATSFAPVLTLYAAGNGFMTLAVFPFNLQYARGDLKLHLRGNILFAAVLVPVVLMATLRYGAIGAGWVWAMSNATFFLLWSPLVHGYMLPCMHRTWLWHDIVRILALPVLLGAAASALPTTSMGRTESGLLVVGLIAVLLGVSFWMAPVVREQCRLALRGLIAR